MYCYGKTCASPLFWLKSFACCLESQPPHRHRVGKLEVSFSCRGCFQVAPGLPETSVACCLLQPAQEMCLQSPPPMWCQSLSSLSSAHSPICLLVSHCLQHLSVFALLCLRNIYPVTALHLVSLCFLIACLCISHHTHGCHSQLLADPGQPGTSSEELRVIAP